MPNPRDRAATPPRTYSPPTGIASPSAPLAAHDPIAEAVRSVLAEALKPIDDRVVLAQAAAESAARCVHRVEDHLVKALPLPEAPESIPPVRRALPTHPGHEWGEHTGRVEVPYRDAPGPARQPSQVDALEAARVVLDGRELETSRKRRDWWVDLAKLTVAGAGSIGLWEVCKALFAHH